MRKSVVWAAVLTLLVATGAMAEENGGVPEHEHEHAESHHRLLVTDVPSPGEIELRGDYIYSYAEGKNELGEKIKDEKSVGLLSVGAGVVKGLKLSATLPYTFVQHQEGNKIKGWNDLILGARFSPTKLVHLPVELAVGLDWQLNTASTEPGRPGAGANVYSPYFAVSKEFGPAIPYFKYQPDVVVKHNADRTNHNLVFGAELEFTERLSLDAAATVTVNGSTPGFKSSTDLEIELIPYVNIARNLYLLPRVAYKFVGDLEDNTGIKVARDMDEFKAGLGLYFLF